jgi:hypothetical protein
LAGLREQIGTVKRRAPPAIEKGNVVTSPLKGRRLELVATRVVSVVGPVSVVLAVAPVTMLAVSAARASRRARSPVVRSANAASLSSASDSSGALAAVIAVPRPNTGAIERRIDRTERARPAARSAWTAPDEYRSESVTVLHALRF